MIEVRPGERHGRWLIVKEVAARSGGQRYVLAKCDCGTVREVHLYSLIKDRTLSCGCISDERRLKHGMASPAIRPPEYIAWLSMRARCTNPHNPRYGSYGARGIRVCDRWDDFDLFMADMGKRPTSEHSIDRIDNDGNYEPANCRWATRKEQSHNKSTNRWIEWDGRRMLLREWATELGIHESTLIVRLRRSSLDRAMTTRRCA